MSGFRLTKKSISATLDQQSGGVTPFDHSTARTEIIANSLAPCTDVTDYAREISKLWTEVQAKFLAIGRYLVAARASLTKRGDYDRLINHELPFARHVAHQLRVVAEAV